MTDTPMTLGEKLASISYEPDQLPTAGLSVRQRIFGAVILLIYGAVIVWVLSVFPDMHLGVIAAIILSWLILRWRLFASKAAGRRGAKRRSAPHFLLVGDQQGFMASLRLQDKTAVIDGSNIYHFGHSNDADAQVLGGVVAQLRDEGYRVVCFFDANIYHTLSEHGAFSARTRHTPSLLTDIFGLGSHEIYVVPSGVQADKYVLTCLRHMPISFAVTNDKFRDYAKQFGAVMKGDEWRKGVMISKNEVKLFKHKFKTPVYVS